MHRGPQLIPFTTYMGHSSIRITHDRHGRLMPGNEEAAAGLLDAYLSRTVGQVRASEGQGDLLSGFLRTA
jgi:hypothetical protein